MELRVLRALPRADEHLRRPRQHPLPPAALRVARDRLRLRRRRPRRAVDPGRTTSSTSAAARTATRARSPRTWSRPSAKRSPRRSTSGAVVLAVCGGYQLLGHSYQLGEEKLPGLGLADLETVREEGPRLIGNVAIEVDLGAGPRVLAGFENHGGRTYLGPGVPRRSAGSLEGPRQQRRRRARGRPPRQPDRHLPARPAAAEERLARRPPDRARARPPLRRAPRARAARRRARGRRPRQRPRRRRRLSRAARPQGSAATVAAGSIAGGWSSSRSRSSIASRPGARSGIAAANSSSVSRKPIRGVR